MKIVKLVLVGYRGFRLRQISRFEYTPVKKTQVILGTNGSGKSSLLKELSPLPANFQDYEKVGSKEITIEHMGKVYFLQSLFDADGRKYLFHCDGVNLNPGCTLTVYRELVKEHFNYTPEVQQLLIGSLRFHEMSTLERRNWFMKISDVDYTYAYKYYTRLKDKVRDIQGALKHTQARLTEETEKCLSQKDEEALRIKIDQYHKVLNDLLSIRIPRLSDRDDLYRRSEQLENLIAQDLNTLESLIETPAALNSFTLEEVLESRLIEAQADIASLKSIVVFRCEVIEKLNSQLGHAKANSQISRSDVEKTIASLERERIEVSDQIRLDLVFNEAVSAEGHYGTIFEDLCRIFEELGRLPKPKYERDGFQELQHKKIEIAQRLEVAKRKEIALFQEIKHLKEHQAKGETSCPKCTHKWVPNFDQNRLTHYELERGVTLKNIEEFTTEAKRIEDEEAAYRAHFGLIDQLNQYSRNFPSLIPLWSFIKGSEKLYTEPDGIRHELQLLKFDLQSHSKIAKIDARLIDLRKQYAEILNAGDLDLEKIEAAHKEETSKLLEVQDKLKEREAELRQVKEYLSVQKTIALLSQRVQVNLTGRKETLGKLFDDERMRLLDDIVYYLRNEISRAERAVSQIDIQKALVEDLKRQVKELEEDFNILKLAMTALSPTEGLIAKGMMGFINHFIAQVNAFITKFWLYPLEVKPLKVIEDGDSFDLDYKFPVCVNNDTRTTKDIAETSAGMREVIDLSFVAVSMLYLGLSQSPVFLDEFAKTLDPAHRQMAYQAIDHLIDSANYTQVFLVSHYQDGYTALTDCDITVLCDSNIQIPKHMAYNKNVKLQ